MTRLPLLLLAAASLLSLTDCVPINSTGGELSNGRFTYTCLNDSDPACDGFTGPTFMPDRLAVGGSFVLGYVPDDSSSDPVQLVPASDEMISTGFNSFKFLAPGVGAMLARNTSGVVSDFIHLRGVSLDHLEITGPGTIDNYEDSVFQVIPKDADGQIPAGALPYTWTVSDPTVVSVQGPSAVNHLDILGLKAGTVTLEVSLPGGLKASRVVKVEYDPENPTTTTTTSGGGGASSSSSSTGSTGAGGAGGGK